MMSRSGLRYWRSVRSFSAADLLVHEFVDQVEDRLSQDGEALLDRFVPDGLREVRLAESGMPDEQGALGLADKLAGGQFVDLFLGTLGL